MRNHLVALIGEAARTRPDILLLTGDLGFSVIEPLQAQLGDRFINAGISEANMMSMAASLSFCGFEPYVYSIVPFVTARCYEQIRNDVCHHAARVRLVGIGAGFSYGTLGPTHHALEDATIMATLPAMTVFSPATLSELDRLFVLSAAIEGPIYYRIGRENGPNLPAPEFDLKRPVAIWQTGEDINLVTSGSLAGPVFAAADQLKRDGYTVQLVTVPVLAPFPYEALVQSLSHAPTLVAFEGYLGNPLENGVLTALAERPTGNAVKIVNAGRAFAKEVGGTDYQRKVFGLSTDAIAAVAQSLFRGSSVS
jgi:transketolase